MENPTELLETGQNCLTRDDKNATLLLCCQNGDAFAHFIPDLIEAGANLRATDENGHSPLFLSAKNGHTMCAQELIAAGAGVEDLDNRRNTPLIVCARSGWTSCAELLLESGADVNACNFDGDTPLIVSSRSSSSYDVVELLISSKRVNLDHRNKRGYSALMFAIETANLNTIKLLIEAGAHLEEQTKIRSIDSEVFWQWKDVAQRKGILKLVMYFLLQKTTGKPPLLLAAFNGDLNSVQLITTMERSIINGSNESFVAIITQYLASFGEKNKMVSNIDLEIFKEMLRCKEGIGLTIPEQGKVMELAVAIGNYEILTILADYSFSITCANLSLTVINSNMVEFLFRKLHLKAKFLVTKLLEEALQLGQVDSAKILAKQGASLDIKEALREAVAHANTIALKFIVEEFENEAYRIIQNTNLLHIAVRGSSVDAISILLDSGADVNKAVEGQYPLTLAKDRQVIDLLLSRNADANVFLSHKYRYPLLLFVSKFFKTVLQGRYSAIDESFVNEETIEIVKSLLRHGGRVDVRNDKGQTALHVASKRSNSKDILNLIIESGVNVNKTDVNGWTALHVAVVHCCVENVRCLIEAGIDLGITDANHHTAFFEISDPKILEVFLQCGVDVNTVEEIEGNTLLLDLLLSNSYSKELLEALIAAGSDLNHRNIDGKWPLLVEARIAEFDIVRLLVASGADLNISTQDAENRTVITELLKNLRYNFHETKECILFCLDHGANLSMLHPCVIHSLISSGCLSLVSKFISFGLAPVQLKMHNKSNVWYTTEFTRNISPLVTALLLNHTDLAQYFVNIKYLLRSDLSVLSGNSYFQQYLELDGMKESHEFLTRNSLQPLPLETLSFIVISDALGSTQDRSSKVQNLRLPQLLKDQLMFRNVEENWIEDSSRKNKFLFKQSMERYKSDDECDDDDDYDDDDREAGLEDEETNEESSDDEE